MSIYAIHEEVEGLESRTRVLRFSLCSFKERSSVS